MLCHPSNFAVNKDSLFEYLNATTFTYSLQKQQKQTQKQKQTNKQLWFIWWKM